MRNKVDTGVVSGRPGLDYQCRTLRGHKSVVTDAIYITSNDIYNEDLISEASHPIVASCSMDKSVSLWSPREGKNMWRKEAHTTPVKHLSVVTHDALVASGDQGGAVKLWDINTGQNTELKDEHPGGVTTMLTSRNIFAQSKGGKKLGLLYVGCREGYIKLWDVRDPTKPQHVLQGKFGLNCIQLQREHLLAVSSSSDDTIQLFDIRNLSSEFKNSLFGSISHPDGDSVTCMVPSSTNENLLAVGYLNGDIILWDTVGRKELHRFHHCSKISALSTFGRILFSVAQDNIMHLWNTKTFAHIQQFEDHLGPITGLYVDAYRVMTCSRDYSIRVYRWLHYDSSLAEGVNRKLESRYTLLGGSLQRAGNGFEKVICDFSSCVGIANDVMKAYSFHT